MQPTERVQSNMVGLNEALNLPVGGRPGEYR